MVDHDAVVCCMCGDMGFPDKLFRCSRCLSRFQHSYCSNYYSDDYSASASSGVCDWCRSEEIRSVAGARQGLGGTKRAKEGGHGAGGRSDCIAGERIKQEESSSSRSGRASKSGGGGGSSSAVVKPGGRRYKLLKDVMC